jgi:hypothetical protein
VGAEMFQADGWTDRHTDKHKEANIRFLQFFERSENSPSVNSRTSWVLETLQANILGP